MTKTVIFTSMWVAPPSEESARDYWFDTGMAYARVTEAYVCADTSRE